MHIEHLINAGLTESEAIIYDYLLKNGESSAGEIIKQTDLKRGNTYNVLDSLVGKGIVAFQEKNKVSHFRIENPRALLEYIERDRQSIDNKKSAIESILPSLISHYQLNTNKPVVTYYEGREGFAYILNDTLTSKTEVLQYADIEIIETRFKKESDDHVKKRGDLHIEKKLLITDSPFTRNLYNTLKEEATSHVRVIKPSDKPFNVVMFIYDNKISYLTLVENKTLGVIIEDTNIYEMHKHIFMCLYDKAIQLTIPQ
ncbi:TPA: hypothetical protein DEP94_03820 [Candidatus Nomurabacteria bacterium]|nr:hypothetical protein [Candidatus Nomurabacteria bacterium]